MGAHHRRTWDEKELARMVAARTDRLTTAEIAQRFGVTDTTIQRRLAELRARKSDWARPRLLRLVDKSGRVSIAATSAAPLDAAAAAHEGVRG